MDLTRREFFRKAGADVAAVSLVTIGVTSMKVTASPLGLPIGSQTYPHRALIKESGFAGLAKTLADAWPLHPATSLILGPVSRQRFAQNERSVFGFLSSAEPHGFQAFLAATPGGAATQWRNSPLWEGQGRAAALVTARTIVHGDGPRVRAAVDAAWAVVPDAGAGPLGELRRALDADRNPPAVTLAISVTEAMRGRAAGVLSIPDGLRRIGARLNLGQDLDRASDGAEEAEIIVGRS